MLVFRPPLLYVIDNEYEASPLHQVLSQHHTACQLRRFQDGPQLVTYLTHRLDGRLPDLIVADWDAPLLSGFELQALLEVNEAYKGIPLVLRTTRDNQQMIRLPLDSQHFLIKADTLEHIAQELDMICCSYLD